MFVCCIQFLVACQYHNYQNMTVQEYLSNAEVPHVANAGEVYISIAGLRKIRDNTGWLLFDVIVEAQPEMALQVANDASNLLNSAPSKYFIVCNSEESKLTIVSPESNFPVGDFVDPVVVSPGAAISVKIGK